MTNPKPILILLFIATLLLIHCKRTDKETLGSEDSLKTNAVVDEDEKKEYQKFKSLFNKGFYLEANFFYNSNVKSIYRDSVQYIKRMMKEKREAVERERTTLSQQSAFKYFDELHLPRLDSITHSDLFVSNHHYKLDFTTFDKKLLASNSGEHWYISKQHQSDCICVTVCYNGDCEGNIVLYSLDKEYNIIDKLMLMHNGCEYEHEEEDDDGFSYEQYIVKESGYSNLTQFANDSTFILISRTTFSLKEVATDKVKNEVGNEERTTYLIDKAGKFQKTDTKKISKDYVKFFYGTAN